jgi:hypothetical protein
MNKRRGILRELRIIFISSLLAVSDNGLIFPSFPAHKARSSLLNVYERLIRNVIYDILKCSKYSFMSLDIHLLIYMYKCAPESTGNMFQDITGLHETANDTERLVYRDIRVTYINMVKFN